MAVNTRERPLSTQWFGDVYRVWAALFAEHDLLTYATAIAFRLLIALVPLTILSLALLGSFGQEHVWDDTLGPAVAGKVTPPVYAGIDDTAQRIFETPGLTLIALGVALSILDVSSGVRSSMGVLNRIYDTDEKRPKALRFGISVAIAIAVIVLFVGALLAVLAAPNLASHGALRWPLAVVRWPVAVVCLGTAIALLVRFGPSEHPRARWATAGGALVIVAWVVASIIFRWYVSSVSNFRSAAGVLIAVLVLTTYLYISSIIFLVGVELVELLRKSAQDASTFRGALRAIARGG
jgi:membrane protein